MSIKKAPVTSRGGATDNEPGQAVIIGNDTTIAPLLQPRVDALNELDRLELAMIDADRAGDDAAWVEAFLQWLRVHSAVFGYGLEVQHVQQSL